MAMSTALAPRRKHIKSRGGCTVCKNRRVKCDELRPQCSQCISRRLRGGEVCEYHNIVSTGPNTPGSTGSPGAFIGLPDFAIFADILPPSWNRQDKALFHEGVSMVQGLQVNDGHLWSLQTAHTPTYYQLALDFPCIRNMLLTGAALQKGYEQKSSDWMSEAPRYRNLAMRDLRHEIDSFSHHNADAILATSIMLASSSTDPNEWAMLLKGAAMVRNSSKQWKEKSALPLLYEDEEESEYSMPPSQTIPPWGLSANEMLMDTLSTSLQQLHSRVKDTDLGEPVLRLTQLVQNLRQEAPEATLKAHFKIDLALRGTSLLNQAVFKKMVVGDPWTLLALAYYECIAIATKAVEPWNSFPHLLTGNGKTIKRIWKYLHSIPEQSPDRFEILSLIEFPYAVARTYEADGRLDSIWVNATNST